MHAHGLSGKRACTSALPASYLSCLLCCCIGSGNLQLATYPCQELSAPEGLGDVVICPALKASHHTGLLSKCTDKDDGDMQGRLTQCQLATHFRPAGNNQQLTRQLRAECIYTSSQTMSLVQQPAATGDAFMQNNSTVKGVTQLLVLHLCATHPDMSGISMSSRIRSGSTLAFSMYSNVDCPLYRHTTSYPVLASNDCTTV